MIALWVMRFCCDKITGGSKPPPYSVFRLQCKFLFIVLIGNIS